MELGEWGDGEALLEAGGGESLNRLYRIKILSIKRHNTKINRRRHLTPTSGLCTHTNGCMEAHISHVHI